MYIAPIEQDMLIGFDILVHRGKFIFDMAKGTLIFDNQLINLDIGSQGSTPLVDRITVAKRQVIPQNSTMGVKCAVGHELPDYVEGLNVITPRVVRGKGQDPVMCLINPSNGYRLLKKAYNQCISS